MTAITGQGGYPLTYKAYLGQTITAGNALTLIPAKAGYKHVVEDIILTTKVSSEWMLTDGVDDLLSIFQGETGTSRQTDRFDNLALEAGRGRVVNLRNDTGVGVAVDVRVGYRTHKVPLEGT